MTSQLGIYNQIALLFSLEPPFHPQYQKKKYSENAIFTETERQYLQISKYP